MGRRKTVDYWQASVAAEHGFVPDDEVSEVRWVGLKEARALLTYRRDVEYVEHALKLPQTTPLIILRHAAAISRTDFDGEDRLRPLQGKGRSQARSLVSLLGAYGTSVVRSSDAVRCLETVRPYARSRKATVEQEPIFSETGFEQSPQAAVERLDMILANRRPTVLCTHRPLLPTLLESLVPATKGPTRQLLRAVISQGLSTGAMMVLHRTTDASPRIVAAEHTRSRKHLHDARSSLSR